MFGVFGAYLALAYTAGHLLRAPELGRITVFAAFVLMGFAVVDATRSKQHAKYPLSLVRPFIRLIVGYWIALVFSLGVLVLMGEANARAFAGDFGIPTTVAAWFMNLAGIFPALDAHDVEPRIIPVAWALSYLWFYVVLALIGAFATPWRVGIVSILGLAYHAIGIATRQPIEFHDRTLIAVALPFAIGAALVSKGIRFANATRLRPPQVMACHMAVAFLCMAASYISMSVFRNDPAATAGRWIDFLSLGAALVMTSAWLGAFDAAGKTCSSAERAVGDYAYPLFLFHMPAALLTSQILFGRPVAGMNLPGFLNAVAAIGLSVLAGYIMNKLTAIIRRDPRLSGKLRHPSE